MEIELKTNSVEDRLRLANWLEQAILTCIDLKNDSTEMMSLAMRLRREAEYYSQREKLYKKEKRKRKTKEQRAKELAEFGITEEELEQSMKEAAEKHKVQVSKMNKTKRDVLKSEYRDAIGFLMTHCVDDEAVTYGKPEEYGGVSCQLKIQAIIDMLSDFIHLKAKNLAKHEFYNDPIDDWYFSYHENPDSEESKNKLLHCFFFPTEAFIIRVGDIYFYYSETHGQGTAIKVSVFDTEGLIKFGEKYGYSLSEVIDKAYIF